MRLPFRLSLILWSLVIALSLTPVLTYAQDGGNTSGNPSAPLGEHPSSYRLDINRLQHIYQGWNNCGPATLTMGLTYFGGGNNQLAAANFLKPHTEDKNVSPWELVAYVNEEMSPTLDVQALYRPAGTLDMIKDLLSHDFPVIIEKGYEPEGYDWMGHYLFVIGYDDEAGEILTYDSFSGHGNFQGLRESYEHVESYWDDFGNIFVVLYQPEREAELMSLLGEHASLERAYQLQAQHYQQLTNENPDDGWNWFNVGDALTHLGRYDLAVEFFRVAFDKQLPWRTLWYRHTPLEAFYQVGDFETTLQLVQSAKQTTPYVEELHYYHGLVFASQGRSVDAKAQFNQALQYNRNFEDAQIAIEEIDNGTFVPVVPPTTPE